MNEQEITQIVNQLHHILRQLGLDWIIDQVDEQIQAGRLVKKEVQMLKEVRFDEKLSSDFSLKPSGKIELTATEDYTLADQLRLLIGAIESTAKSIADIRGVVTTFFNQEGRRVGVSNTDVIISNAPDQFKSFSEFFSTDEQAIEQLSNLLQEILREIDS